MTKHTLNITIVGMRFRNNYQFSSEDNNKIYFQHDNTNVHDKNAIGVYLMKDDTHVAYVMKNQTSWMLPFIQNPENYKYKVKFVKESFNIECPICYNESTIQLHCTHTMCTTCFIKCYHNSYQQLCPICRIPIKIEQCKIHQEKNDLQIVSKGFNIQIIKDAENIR